MSPVSAKEGAGRDVPSTLSDKFLYRIHFGPELEGAVPYQNPTLLGLAYASRLFREVDDALAFEEFRGKTGPALDLQNPDNGHAQALLTWLNKWNCRISGKSFPRLSLNLAEWNAQWVSSLPQLNVELTGVGGQALDILADAYNALRALPLGPTAAAKTLFAVRSEVAIPWDDPIRAHFKLNRGDRDDYRSMLALSKSEAEMLIADAARCGVASQHIARAIGSPDRTLVRLLDEYHWIAITQRHQTPTAEELEQWVGWVSPQRGCQQ